MKKITLTLFVCLSCIMVVDAQYPHVLDSNSDFDSSEYTTIWLKKMMYDVFGTFNPK